MRLAVIPARGGSKRIPKKNIVPFFGRPMISYAISAAEDSRLFDKIHVSTDSQEIADIVHSLGHPVDFMRDSSLADDQTGIVPVLRWVVNEFVQRQLKFEQLCCIMPNAPLLRSSDLVEAFQVFDAHRASHPLLVYARYPVPVEWAFRGDGDGFMTADNPEKILLRSQDLPHAYYECGPFSIWTPEHLLHHHPVGGKTLAYLMPADRAIDIDTPEDLDHAERLFQLMR
jgi:pseudaminic acid cytidylyltransferase